MLGLRFFSNETKSYKKMYWFCLVFNNKNCLPFEKYFNFRNYLVLQISDLRSNLERVFRKKDYILLLKLLQFHLG